MYRLENKGVTILELLVVILLIGGLIFLLNPLLKHIRFVIKQQQCMDNLKSMSLALRIYALENKHNMPDNLEELVEKGYIKEGTVFCPFQEKKEEIGYIYKKLASIDDVEDVPIIRDKKDCHPNGSINVLYSNGGIKNKARWPSS